MRWKSTRHVPLTLRVEGRGGDPAAWFTIARSSDTTVVERRARARVVETTRGGWRTCPLAFAAP